MVMDGWVVEWSYPAGGIWHPIAAADLSGVVPLGVAIRRAALVQNRWLHLRVRIRRVRWAR